MIMALSYLLRRELKDRFPSFFTLMAEVLMISLGLCTYWYTAKALQSSTPSPLFGNYFDYLVIGELTLFIPLALLSGMLRMIRTSLAEGTFEILCIMPLSPQVPFLLMNLASILRELISWLIIFGIASGVFQLHLPLNALLMALLLQVLSFPLFLGLGLTAASILLRLGRGEALLTHFSTFASILAGVYFPTQVLPPLLQTLAYWASPFSRILQCTRSLLTQGWNPAEHGIVFVTISLEGMVAFALGYFLLGYSLMQVRHKGLPIQLVNR